MYGSHGSPVLYWIPCYNKTHLIFSFFLQNQLELYVKCIFFSVENIIFYKKLLLLLLLLYFKCEVFFHFLADLKKK